MISEQAAELREVKLTLEKLAKVIESVPLPAILEFMANKQGLEDEKQSLVDEKQSLEDQMEMLLKEKTELLEKIARVEVSPPFPSLIHMCTHTRTRTRTRTHSRIAQSMQNILAPHTSTTAHSRSCSCVSVAIR